MFPTCKQPSLKSIIPFAALCSQNLINKNTRALNINHFPLILLTFSSVLKPFRLPWGSLKRREKRAKPSISRYDLFGRWDRKVLFSFSHFSEGCNQSFEKSLWTKLCFLASSFLENFFYICGESLYPK